MAEPPWASAPQVQPFVLSPSQAQTLEAQGLVALIEILGTIEAAQIAGWAVPRALIVLRDQTWRTIDPSGHGRAWVREQIRAGARPRPSPRKEP